VRKGDIVFALGSPGGLRDSVSMGVVSTAARQLDPDSPLVYIQTDAAINPGNSGGPLVNVDGELVGINTFILSQSGGNQGLGFAIPSAVVAAAYPKLRKYGHLQRDDIGVSVQGVTPLLASGLELPQDWGVIVADVLEGGPPNARVSRCRTSSRASTASRRPAFLCSRCSSILTATPIASSSGCFVARRSHPSMWKWFTSAPISHA